MKLKYLLLLGIIVIAGGVLFWKGTQGTKPTNKPKTTSVLPKEVTITLDKNGFSPQEVTIKTGTAVRWKNISGDQQSVNSDDHPTHQKHKELNFGIFNNGSSVVYTFTSPGEFGYHNHLHPEQTGKIIVK